MAGPTTAFALLEPRARPRYSGGSAQAVARPLIGISSYGRAGQRQTFSLPCEYVDVVRLAGGGPVGLPAGGGGVPPAPGGIARPIPPGGGARGPAPPGGGRPAAPTGAS